jgi:hypothetical protein
VVRIAAWNCRSALDHKLKVVDATNADVLTTEECSAETALSRLQEAIATSDRIPFTWFAPVGTALTGIA